MLRMIAVTAVLVFAGNAWAEDDDPKLAAALLKCPNAAAFINAEKVRGQGRRQTLINIVPNEPQLRE